MLVKTFAMIAAINDLRATTIQLLDCSTCGNFRGVTEQAQVINMFASIPSLSSLSLSEYLTMSPGVQSSCHLARLKAKLLS